MSLTDRSPAVPVHLIMYRGSIGGYGRRVLGSKRTTLVGYCSVHRTARRGNYSDIWFSPDVVIAQFDVLSKLMK